MTDLISIIIPTKNSSKFLEECLDSIKKQSYKDLELIVVDNYSTDQTKEIVEEFKKRFAPLNVQLFNRGPERSAQRNFGVRQAKGKFVLIIDSDMKLSENVVKSCVEKIYNSPLERGRLRSRRGVLKPSAKSPAALIIPEESFGIGFWAKCKKLERSFYIGVDWMEAARFFEKEIFEKAGGYDQEMVSGEDWDLSQRVEQFRKVGRISDLIYHNEGKVSLSKTIKKKFYYAGKFAKYVEKNCWLHCDDSPAEPNCRSSKNFSKQTGIISRYKLFLSQPKKLFKDPFIGIGMLLMKTCEFAFGAIGYLIGKAKK